MEKFNNTLLKDKDYISNSPLKNIWEPSIVLGTTENGNKKHDNCLFQNEKGCQRKLEELDTDICNNQNLGNDILENVKKEVTEIFSIKGKKAPFRSRTRWIENCEKPIKYFFDLEKRNYEKKRL